MDALSISTQEWERQEGCMGHPLLRSFLPSAHRHSMPFPSFERRHQNLRVHAKTSAAFSLCTVLMQWMLRILGKTVALTSPPQETAPHSSAPSDPTAVVPCSRVGRKHILQSVRDNEGWSLPADSPPQTPAHRSSWRSIYARAWCVPQRPLLPAAGQLVSRVQSLTETSCVILMAPT